MNACRLAIFDLDHTLLCGNCSFAFCRYLVQRRVLPFYALLSALFYYAQHLFFGMNLKRLHAVLFRLFLNGMKIKKLEAHIEPFLEQYLDAHWYKPALDCLRLAQKHHCPVVLLSNSPSFLVERIAARLRVDRWGATEYAVDRQGTLCHIAKVMEGEEKALFAKEIAQELCVPLASTEAYSDSIADLPLLLQSGRAVGVNPDRALRKICKQKGWDIL